MCKKTLEKINDVANIEWVEEWTSAKTRAYYSPCYLHEVSDSLRVQTLTVLSFEPLARYLPSGENAQHVTYLTIKLLKNLPFLHLPFIKYIFIEFGGEGRGNAH